MGLQELVLDGLSAIRKRMPSFDSPINVNEPEKNDNVESQANDERKVSGQPEQKSTNEASDHATASLDKATINNPATSSSSVRTLKQSSEKDGSNRKRKDAATEDETEKTLKRKSMRKRNELTHLIPGYTAPLTLSSSSLDKFRPPGGLETIRKQAMAIDHPMPATGVTSGAAKPPGKKRTNKLDHAGDGWFQMRSTPMTDEVKKDLQLIRNRNYIDPKRFYKSSDPVGKFVQIGTVIEGPSEYFSSRLTKKERRTNLVDEILADKSTSQYAQNKYKEMQRENTAKAEKRRRSGRLKRP